RPPARSERRPPRAGPRRLPPRPAGRVGLAPHHGPADRRELLRHRTPDRRLRLPRTGRVPAPAGRRTGRARRLVEGRGRPRPCPAARPPRQAAARSGRAGRGGRPGGERGRPPGPLAVAPRRPVLTGGIPRPTRL